MLVEEGIRFPVIHVDKLRELVPAQRHVAGVDVDLGGLARWERAARYPAADEATETDAREALEAARCVVDAARADIER